MDLIRLVSSLRADGIIWCNVRGKGTRHFISEFVQPHSYMVQRLALDLWPADRTQLGFSTVKRFLDWIVEKIRYKYDVEIHKQTDFWQFPWETLILKTGDCEDTTFLTQSVLEALGFNSRGVLGIVNVNGEKYGHAWVEIEVDGYTRVIETTYEDPGADYISFLRPSFYEPVFFFNSKSCVYVGPEVVDAYSDLLGFKPKWPKQLPETHKCILIEMHRCKSRRGISAEEIKEAWKKKIEGRDRETN